MNKDLEALDLVKKGINYYGGIVASRIHTDIEDVKQELSINVVLKARAYDENSKVPLNSYLMTNLYWAHLSMIDKHIRHKQIVDKKLALEYASLKSIDQTFENDRLNSILLDEVTEVLPVELMKVYSMRVAGYKWQEIRDITGLAKTTIRRHTKTALAENNLLHAFSA